MPSAARVVSGVSLAFFAAFGTAATFSFGHVYNACKLVKFPMVAEIGTLTEAECGAILASATKSAPRGKEDATAALVDTMGSVIIKIEGVCFFMIMCMAWSSPALLDLTR